VRKRERERGGAGKGKGDRWSESADVSRAI
jgi:hypothetical protein